MASAKSTTDHDQIRQWVEARGGYPARVKATGRGSDPGILRIDFPGFSGEETLERIDWDEFFDWFDRDKLEFLYQDSARSRFSKFVSRGSTKRPASRKRTATTKKTTRKRAASATAKKRTAAPKRTTTRAAKRTRSHNVIRRWVEARGGWPATVRGTKTRGEEAGLLRIDYPGYSGQRTLRRIDWDDFFDKFDEEKLTFLYQDTPRSRFSKFIRS